MVACIYSLHAHEDAYDGGLWGRARLAIAAVFRRIRADLQEAVPWSGQSLGATGSVQGRALPQLTRALRQLSLNSSCNQETHTKKI